MTWRRLPPLGPAAVAAVAAVGFAVVLHLPFWTPLTRRALDDLGQLAAAGLASLTCWRRARRRGGAQQRSWLLLASGTGAWACGEALWSYEELLSGRPTPFPSPADAGFLLFPVLAGAGLLLWPSASSRRAARHRALLDGALVAGSLFLVSWATALGSTLRAGADGALASAVSLAYPVTDLVLLTVTVLVVTRAEAAVRSSLTVLALGLCALGVADSGFAWLTATGNYHTGSAVDVGWCAGFLLLAAASRSPATEHAPHEGGGAPGPGGRGLLPYVPAGAGLAAALVGGLSGQGSRVTLAAATVVVAALLGRQLLTVLDNQQLVAELLTAQRALHHQAFHDPLTGLANRALFSEHLQHGLELHKRDLRPLTLLYCDLDGFKAVNDTLGHDAGDVVLKAAAERLQALTRRGDTVARLGGDEFAVLLEDGGDAAGVAAKVLSGFARPVVLDGCPVTIGVSVGVASLDAAGAPLTATELLRRADSAMYAAKRSGKGTAAFWSCDTGGVQVR